MVRLETCVVAGLQFHLVCEVKEDPHLTGNAFRSDSHPLGLLTFSVCRTASLSLSL